MYIPLVVDNAYTCDPRIKKFKEDEKERKLAEKKAKEDAARAAAEEKERVSIDTLSECPAFIHLLSMRELKAHLVRLILLGIPVTSDSEIFSK